MRQERPTPRLTSSPLFEIDDTAYEWGYKSIEDFIAQPEYMKARMVALLVARGWRELVYTNSDKLEGLDVTADHSHV